MSPTVSSQKKSTKKKHPKVHHVPPSDWIQWLASVACGQANSNESKENMYCTVLYNLRSYIYIYHINVHVHVSKTRFICKKLLLDRIEHFHTVFTQVTIAPVLSTHRQRWTHYIVHVEHGTEPFSRLIPRWDDFHHVAPRKKRWTEPNVDIKASASNLQDGRSKLLIDSEIHLCSLQKRQMILCKKQKTGFYSKLIECSIFVLSSMFGFSLGVHVV